MRLTHLFFFFFLFFNKDLTDHLSLVPQLRTRLAESISSSSPLHLAELVVLDHRNADQSLILSRKAALVDAVRNQRCPASIDEVISDSILIVQSPFILRIVRFLLLSANSNSLPKGHVTNVSEEHGVFVRFLADCSALAPRRSLVDGSLSEVAKHFTVGQTVRAKVLDIAEDKKRFTVSLKGSDTAERDQLFLRTLVSCCCCCCCMIRCCGCSHPRHRQQKSASSLATSPP